MIYLKSDHEIEIIRQACQILVKTFREVEKILRPGIATKEIERLVEEFIRSQGARPSFRGFQGYPASVCISIESEVVHGIPGNRRLREGEIVGIDIGVEFNGYYGDAAKTYAIGNISPRKRLLLKATREALWKGIEQAHIGNRISDISHAIQKHVERYGFSVVRELVGHGVGRDVWEEPQIPNFGEPGKGPKIQKGMVLAIEPMVNMGSFEVETLEDGWTVRTADGLPSAHFEHTVAITSEGPVVLTEGI